MSRLPTAEQVAAIILAAARECGENPLDIVDGQAGSRARIYAYVALRERVPGLTIRQAATLCSAPNIDGLKAYAIQAVRRDWWSPALLARVLLSWPPSVSGDQPVVETPIEIAPVATPSPAPPVAWPATKAPARVDDRVEILRPAKPAPVMCLNPVARRAPPARSSVDLTPSLAGDPPPGRSALDEKRRQQALKTGASA